MTHLFVPWLEEKCLRRQIDTHPPPSVLIKIENSFPLAATCWNKHVATCWNNVATSDLYIRTHKAPRDLQTANELLKRPICVKRDLFYKRDLFVAPYVSQVSFEYKRDLLVSDSFAKELYLCADSSLLIWVLCHLTGFAQLVWGTSSRWPSFFTHSG